MTAFSVSAVYICIATKRIWAWLFLFVHVGGFYQELPTYLLYSNNCVYSYSGLPVKTTLPRCNLIIRHIKSLVTVAAMLMGEEKPVWMVAQWGKALGWDADGRRFGPHFKLNFKHQVSELKLNCKTLSCVHSDTFRKLIKDSVYSHMMKVFILW